MLLHDECITKRDHEQDTKDTADHTYKCDQGDTRIRSLALACPHEDGWQGKDCSCGYRLTGRTDGLNHVVLKDGISVENESHKPHRYYCCRD